MESKLASASRNIDKVATVMEEFKAGSLHSGSAKGKLVTNPKQAIAIAISEKKRQEESGGNYP